jgi:hypothetical protein
MSDTTSTPSAPASTPSTSAPAPAPAPAAPSNPSEAPNGSPSVSNDNGGPARQAPPLWSDEAEVEVEGFDGQKRKLRGRDLVDFYRKSESANAKYQRAAAIEREMQALQAGLKTPAEARAILAKVGVSPRQFAEELLRIELEEERLTPEQRELRDLRAQREQWERQQAEEDEAYQREEAERQAAAFQQEVTRRFTKAIDTLGKDATPPERDWLMREMARLARVDAQQSGQYRSARAYFTDAKASLDARACRSAAVETG